MMLEWLDDFLLMALPSWDAETLTDIRTRFSTAIVPHVHQGSDKCCLIVQGNPQANDTLRHNRPRPISIMPSQAQRELQLTH